MINVNKLYKHKANGYLVKVLEVINDMVIYRKSDNNGEVISKRDIKTFSEIYEVNVPKVDIMQILYVDINTSSKDVVFSIMYRKGEIKLDLKRYKILSETCVCTVDEWLDT